MNATIDIVTNITVDIWLIISTVVILIVFDIFIIFIILIQTATPLTTKFLTVSNSYFIVINIVYSEQFQFLLISPAECEVYSDQYL